MSIVSVGSNQKYADGWDAAFGGRAGRIAKKKSAAKGNATATKKSAKSNKKKTAKAAKKNSAKTKKKR